MSAPKSASRQASHLQLQVRPGPRQTAKAVGIPLVLTSSMEDAQVRLLDDLKEIAPEEDEARIKRPGVVNAMMTRPSPLRCEPRGARS